MAINNTTKMANRFGLDIKLYKYSEDGTIGEPATPLATIDFANECSLELTSEITWATGGQAHKNMIGFKDPTEGTFKLSTQITNGDIMKLAAGNSLEDAESKTKAKATYSNDAKASGLIYYIIKASTVFQGEDGVAYDEEITLYKASVKPGCSITYSGEGDPQSVDIEFELAANKSGKVADIERKDQAGG